MPSHVDPDDLARIQGKLEDILPVARATLQALAIEVKGKIAKAPKQPKHRMKMTRKQRAFVMRAIREGLIEVPWRRAMSAGSEALSKSWATEIENDGLRAVIGNDTSYGPFVQDRENQSLFHQQTGWITVQDVQEQTQPVLAKKFASAVRKALGG